MSTMMKRELKFDKVSHGHRDDEKKVLMEAYNRVTDGSVERIFVKGLSGTGKSTLVYDFQEELKRSKFKFYYAPAKFDESLQQDPFAVIARALDTLCDKIAQSVEEVKKIRNRIPEAVLQELPVLYPMIPRLAGVVGSESTEEAKPAEVSAMATKVNYLLLKLLQCISTKDKPVILFLDDLQWINAPSLEFLEWLLTDAKLSHLLFVGCYRSDEVDESKDEKQEANHRLHSLFAQLKDYDRPFTTITITNLTRWQLVDYLTELLEYDNDDKKSQVQPLADSLHRKTQGNPFYLQSYLQLLVERGILSFDYSTYTWQCDLQSLENLGIADNVVAVILDKMYRRLLEDDKDTQMLLRIMSTGLPSTFDETVLLKLLEKCDIMGTDHLQAQMDLLIKEGLLIRNGRQYSFAHDRIRHACTELLAEDSKGKNTLDLKLGRALAAMATEENAQDWLVFAAIDRLEAVNIQFQNDDERKETIAYYIMAAELSSQSAAHSVAARHYEKAVDLYESLEESIPYVSKEYHQVCLAAAEVEFHVGNYEKGYSFCEAVTTFSHDEDAIIRSRLARSDALMKQKKSVEGSEECKRVLIALGEHSCSIENPLSAIVNFTSMKSRLNKMSKKDIVGLPLATDPHLQLKMRALESLVIQCGNSGKMLLAVQCCFKMICNTLEEGLTKHSAMPFIIFASVNTKALGDEKFGIKMKEIAVELFDKIPGSSSMVPLLAAVDVDSWYAPLNSLRGSFDKTFEYAMSSGDSFGGIMSFFINIYIAFQCGVPLSLCSTEAKIALTMLRQYQVTQIYVMFKPFDELISCLTGEIDDPIHWIEDFVIPGRWGFDTNRQAEMVQGCLNRAIGSYIFRRLDLAERYVYGFRRFANHGGAFFEVIWNTFLGPLVAMERFRETRKWKYRHRIQREIRTLRRLAKEKGLNVIHRLFIVEAVHAATFPKKQSSNDNIQAKFDKAIAASRKSGFIADAALGSELAGEHFLRTGDEFWAKHYLSEAAQLYREWGANGKVRQMLEHHGSSLIEVSEQAGMKMSTTRKPRYSMASRVMQGSLHAGEDWSHQNLSSGSSFQKEQPVH